MKNECGKVSGRIGLFALIGVLLASTLLLGGCNSDDQTAETDKSTAVETAVVEIGTIQNSTVVRGNVAATEDVYVVPKTSGVVRSVNVSVGDYISNGQTICQLDTSDLQTSLALAQSQLDTLTKSYEQAVKNRDRYAALYAEGAVSLAQYEQAESAVDQMGMESVRLQVQQVQDQINRCTVTSTVSGLVAEVNVNPGDMAGSSYVARVVNIDKVKLTANVTENMLSCLSEGMQVSVHIDAASGEPFNGVVTAMPVAANATLTYPVEITIDNPNHVIMAGMFAEVDVLKEEAADALIIPKSAVNNNNEVYVVRDGCAYVQTVETGMSDDDNIEILSGLNKGDEVVTVGAYLLADGVQVRVVNSDTGSSAQSE